MADEEKSIHELMLNAASKGHLDSVQRLYDKGADVNYDAARGLANAAYNRHEEVVKFLLERGADIDLAIEGTNPANSPNTMKHLREYKASMAEHMQAYLKRQEEILREFKGFEKDGDSTVTRKQKLEGGRLTIKQVFNFEARQVVTIAEQLDGMAMDVQNFSEFTDTTLLDTAYEMLLKHGGDPVDWKTQQVAKKKADFRM